MQELERFRVLDTLDESPRSLVCSNHSSGLALKSELGVTAGSLNECTPGGADLSACRAQKDGFVA